MEILLDTHIFLWYISGDPRLPSSTLNLIRDPQNEAFLSSISVWEILVKHQLGKLPIPQPPGKYIPLQRDRHHIKSLPLDEASVTQLPLLPQLHRDPFDRMLMCQAMHNELVFASTDRAILEYAAFISII